MKPQAHIGFVVLAALLNGSSAQDKPVGSSQQSNILSFNTREIDSIQYEVKISNEPVLQETSNQENQMMTMVNKFGQKYRCLLPDIDIDRESISPFLTMSPEGENNPETVVKKPSTPLALSTENVKTVLAPMEKEPCLIRTKDWWSYELCYGKYVRQFHLEDGRPSGKILVLGNYDHEQDWSETRKDSKNGKVTHHSQYYTNGTVCDLTGGYRKSEIRYVCDPLEVPDRIIRVDEPQSCDYIITVATSKICSISQLRPEEVPKPKKISCSPLFDQHEYDQYLAIKEKRVKIFEEKRKEMEQKGLEKMLEVVQGEDVGDIDVATEEGLNKLEGMVGDKLADNLIHSLNDLMGVKKPAAAAATKRKPVQKFKEIELPSGEKKSVPIDDDEEPKSDLKVADDLKKLWQKAADEIKTGFPGLEDKMEALEEILEDTEAMINKVQELEGQLSNKLVNAIKKGEDEEDEDMLDAAKHDKGQQPEEQTEAKPVLESELSSDEHTPKEVKKEDGEMLEGQEEGAGQKDVIRVSNLATDATKVRGVAHSDSEKRVVRHLENSIKQKIANSGLEFGGRTIEVKVITAGPGSSLAGKGDMLLSDSSSGAQSDEEKQLQGMVYNLMVGNQQGYADIDNQMQMELNYKFSLDELAKDTDEQEKSIAASQSPPPEGASVPPLPTPSEEPDSEDPPKPPTQESGAHDGTEL